MKRKYILAILISSFFFGCASKNGTENVEKIIVIDTQKTSVRYRPIIGSRNSDSRMAVNLGVVLKAWIAPYKTKSNIMVAGHDIYFWVEKPDFITGSSVPRKNRSVGATTPNKKLPFSLSPKDIDRSDTQNDRTIFEFIDNAQDIEESSVINNISTEEVLIKKKKQKTQTKQNKRSKK